MFEKEAEEWVLELNEKDPYAFPYGGEELRQAYKDGAEFGYNKASEEMKDIIKKLLHKLIMTSAPYKTDLTEEEIAEIRKFIPEE